jgi:cellobiose phosphorylase
LPLIGCGDWNDGMNLIGEHGKGESVWLAFFLYDVLKRFAPLAGGETTEPSPRYARNRLKSCGKISSSTHGMENGIAAPTSTMASRFGSATNPECQIDGLPQSWSILSGAGDAARSRTALEAVMQRLVRREAQLIQLFDPPFDKSHLEPGYVKGYVPGVRENGGPYTHAAIWTVMASPSEGERGRGNVQSHQSRSARQHPGGRGSLQSRTLRHGGRCL